LATRGKADVVPAWWHANNFPVHRLTDTFDDVITAAVATGAIDGGADTIALRGSVHVQFFIARVLRHPS